MANSIIGTHGSIGRRLHAGEVAEPAPLEQGDHDAVGRADRQQVHDHGLERHQQRAEHDHQQQERQHQHGAEEDRQPLGQVVGEVDVDGHDAGDEHLGAGRPPRPAGSTSSRRRLTSSVVASSCGPVVGHDDPARPPSGSRGRWAAAGETKTTPGIGRDRLGDGLEGGDWSAPSASSATSRSGPLKPSPKPVDEQVVGLLGGGVVGEVALVGEARAAGSSTGMARTSRIAVPARAAVHGRCWMTRLQR